MPEGSIFARWSSCNPVRSASGLLLPAKLEGEQFDTELFHHPDEALLIAGSTMATTVSKPTFLTIRFRSPCRCNT